MRILDKLLCFTDHFMHFKSLARIQFCLTVTAPPVAEQFYPQNPNPQPPPIHTHTI